eukprot:TRINITY_DN6943_c0_g1_i1.p1 TRINITY_DN6943_c0_g1~~TRINITY_DN6943_c0_g1_i1.p1  ORF type:complete len:448 (-),score=159.42 TRINITY_DN6943_c0_g1_i1:106-1371(-)
MSLTDAAPAVAAVVADGEVDSSTTEESPAVNLKWVTDDPRSPAEVLGVVKRNQVFLERQFNEVKVVEFEGIDCNGAPLLEGFPSIGLVSVIAAKELVKILNLPLIGIIKAEDFQSSAVITSEQPSHAVRIYGNKKLVIILSEMTTPFPASAMDDVVAALYDFAHRHRCPMIYSVAGVSKPEMLTLPTGEEVQINLTSGGGEEGEEEGGAAPSDETQIVIDDTLLTKLVLREKAQKEARGEITAEDLAKEKEEKEEKKKKKKKKARNNNPLRSPASKRKKDNGDDSDEEDIQDIADEMFKDNVHYVTTNIEVAKKLRGDGHIPVVDGIIPGITGGILAHAPLTNQDVTVLLVPASAVFPDPDAAIRCIEILDSLLNNVSLEKANEGLAKEGEDLKKLMKGLMSGIDFSSLRKSGTVPYGMYQ